MSKNTVSFKQATDYLKEIKYIRFTDLIKELGITRGRFDSMRLGRTNPPDDLVSKLKEIYPETSRFFEVKNSLQEPKFLFSNKESDLVKALREIISTKDEIIQLKDEKIKSLEKDLEAANTAHAETLKKLYTEEEARVEYEKRKKEYEEIIRKEGEE